MARCRVAMEKLPPYRNAVLYRVLDDIDYVIPSFEVLRVRLHRCIFAVIQDDGSEGELIEGFINSATIRGQIHRVHCAVMAKSIFFHDSSSTRCSWSHNYGMTIV